MSTSSVNTRTPRPSQAARDRNPQAANIVDKIADYITGPLVDGFGFGIRLLGPLFIIAFYALVGLHLYAYFMVVLFVLRKRLGTFFGLTWVGIGLCILYNICFNHTLAAFIKPGSPADLRKIE